jgi:hypothetical protein
MYSETFVALTAEITTYPASFLKDYYHEDTKANNLKRNELTDTIP